MTVPRLSSIPAMPAVPAVPPASSWPPLAPIAPIPRVLLLCQSLAQAGGVERFACALANHLAGQGFAAALGSVDTPASEVAYPVAPGVRLLTAAGPRPAAPAIAPPTAGLGRRWQLLRNQWRTGRSLARLVRAEQPDVVILNGLTTACSVLLCCPGCARRAVCCDHNHFEARSRPWRWLRARLYPKVAALVSLTEADAPKFRALNPRTEVIANASTLANADATTLGGGRAFALGGAGAPTLGSADAPDAASADASTRGNAAAWLTSADTLAAEAGAMAPIKSPDRSPAGSPSEPRLLVLAIGRCVAQKGFDLLLLAWQQVLQASATAAPAARLRIVGDGPLRHSLIAEARRLRIDHSIEWLPPTADIARHYREASIFVLPSRYEGQPLVLLEAQAMGLPAVAFDCPTGPAEIVTPETGIVVPALDVAALADGLARLIAEPALRQRMGLAARQRSRLHFSAAAHFERWTALVAAVAARHGPARHHA